MIRIKYAEDYRKCSVISLVATGYLVRPAVRESPQVLKESQKKWKKQIREAKLGKSKTDRSLKVPGSPRAPGGPGEPGVPLWPFTNACVQNIW